MTVLERTQLAAAPNAVESQSGTDKPAFLYRHVVCFEETNVVGNVYFARHVSWQGRCRETFLRSHAPSILDEIKEDLRLVTLKVSCEYFSELQAFDEIEIRMRLAFLRQHRIGLDFDYFVLRGPSEGLAARGFQEIGCMRVARQMMIAVAPPAELLQALRPYG